ncbi:MAG: tRNA (adenosine(37)-N6)-threonylcarbamoyltransferase complex ATPase subunit type 1 TsaE [Bacteroidota bacterium]|nr:tRNA (adenosine(37)-N6)-threonylcarbamoyltransferase complex ATPase subunit type 1 TsaE [Bacteroidota bacterium]
MFVKDIYIRSLEDLQRGAREFLSIIENRKIFAFNGKMGAGKTTFIKAICEELGVEDNVCSPTFAIVNVYLSKQAGEIYHFDFYRLEDESQALDIGIEEYFYSGNYCFMEWAENIPSLLPENCVNVNIIPISQKERKITIQLP